MASPKENCQNCYETFYQQSLLPLELVDFTFGGQQLTLVGCFVESSLRSFTNSDCTKVCRTCLELIRTTFVGNDRVLFTDQKAVHPTHMCATCADFYPVNVMMSMQLTVIFCNGRSVKLFDCYNELCTKQEVTHDGKQMVCLACVSAIARTYMKRSTQTVIDGEVTQMEDVKTEPFLTVASPVGRLSKYMHFRWFI
jgi:hypothetical protein